MRWKWGREIPILSAHPLLQSLQVLQADGLGLVSEKRYFLSTLIAYSCRLRNVASGMNETRRILEVYFSRSLS